MIGICNYENKALTKYKIKNVTRVTDIFFFKEGVCKDFDNDCLFMTDNEVFLCYNYEPVDVCIMRKI